MPYEAKTATNALIKKTIQQLCQNFSLSNSNQLSTLLFFLIKSMDDTVVNIEYLYAFLVLQLIRYKIIVFLGFVWTKRIIVIDKHLVKTFLFKYFRHPNYIVVILEIILVCLFFDDFLALIFFTFCHSFLYEADSDAILLRMRTRVRQALVA